MHAYNFDAKKEQDHRDRLNYYVPLIEKQIGERQAPFYLGEFNLEPHGTPATMAAYVTALGRHGWSWSVWTYKVVMKGGDRSMWGLYRNPRPVEPLDPFRDSEAELVRKMAQDRTERLEEYPGMADVYRASAGNP
jgi:hypothetical protein